MDLRPPPPEKFFVAGGTLRDDAPSYIHRPADDELFEALLASEFCNVLTARQMGKSSLMVRTMRRLQAAGVRTAIIDLSELGTGATEEQWYLGLLRRIAVHLSLAVDVDEWQQEHANLSPVDRFGNFLQQVVLAEVIEPVVIFLDEIDSTLQLPFTDDFFVAVRAMYNSRAINPEFRRLTFVLLGVARPAELIKDTSRTPYNIGKDIDLTRFTYAEVHSTFCNELERIFPEKSAEVTGWVLAWTGGQPYLTQKVFTTLVERRSGMVTQELVDEVARSLFLGEASRSESNLRAIRERIRNVPKRDRRRMLQLYARLLRDETVRVVELSVEQNLLKLTGLVSRDAGGVLRISNKIYVLVFDAAWVSENMPANPATPWIGVSIALAVLIGAFFIYSYYQRVNQSAEARAEVYRQQVSSGSVEVRLSGYAGLFGLGGAYLEEALQSFLTLPADQQQALFNGAHVATLPAETLAVAQNVYARVPNTADGNDLLRAIAEALRNVNLGGAADLEAEITYWLDGRAGAASGEHELAQSSYTRALERSSKDGSINAAIQFDRGQSYIVTGDYDQALADLQAAYAANEWQRADILNTISDAPALRDYFETNRGQYANFWQVAALPTSTVTRTAPAVASATATVPRSTSTRTPTVTASLTPTPGPLDVADRSWCTSVGFLDAQEVSLTVINRSGFPIVMKLTHCHPDSGRYYFLEIPTGSTEKPYIEAFKISVGIYARESWQCNGLVSRGLLVMESNTRLTFTECGRTPVPRTPTVVPGLGSIQMSRSSSPGTDVRLTMNNPTE